MPLDFTTTRIYRYARRPVFSWLPTLAALALTLSVPRTVDSAPGIALVPHVARYSLSRNFADPDSGVAAIKGMMEVRLEISCDGYKVDQYLGFNVLGEDESQFEHLAYLSSFEDKPGREFYFEARTFENRRLTEDLAGKVRIEDSGEGEIRYARPETVTEPLPGNTVFPIKHLELIIGAALKGEKSVRHTVFDGSTRENPFEISTFIGAASDGESKNIEFLSGSTFWPVRLAYFKVGSVSPAPEFEMSAEVFENGVIGNMIYDYGNFAIDVTLEEVEALKKPEC
ncbi:MAG TPA: DUF1849 family protein [Gammaproteobacteria bacterium]|nr:DUF1849 family protein [Gammaproteobacteria bacterium]